MGVTFKVIDTAGSVIKQKRIQNLNDNLLETAYKLIRKEYGLGFENYYEYSIVFSEDEPFPFIIRDNKCMWHVPVDDVTINDFMITHGISDDGVIIINEVGLGSGDPHFYIYELVSWVIALWPIVADTVTLVEIVKRVSSVYRKLIGKDKKPALPFEVLELLNTRDEWTTSEIKQTTHIDSEKDIELLLLQGNFKKENGKYTKNQIKKNEIEHPINSYYENAVKTAKECWGEYDTDYEHEISSVAETAHHLNCALTSLLLQSELHNSKSFDSMMAIIESFIEEWDVLVCRGEKLQFVAVNNESDAFLENEDNGYILHTRLQMLEHDMKMLIRYAYCICENLERKNYDYL